MAGVRRRKGSQRSRRGLRSPPSGHRTSRRRWPSIGDGSVLPARIPAGLLAWEPSDGARSQHPARRIDCCESAETGTWVAKPPAAAAGLYDPQLPRGSVVVRMTGRATARPVAERPLYAEVIAIRPRRRGGGMSMTGPPRRGWVAERPAGARGRAPRRAQRHQRTRPPPRKPLFRAGERSETTRKRVKTPPAVVFISARVLYIRSIYNTKNGSKRQRGSADHLRPKPPLFCRIAALTLVSAFCCTGSMTGL